ncbi:hypothetical protein U8527_21705 [Kordia algicida OT-1]|uniref:Uncharacterized protein n=1 Tax=Kordia algicida OT-1 TaxID=391587 RepID=A9DQ72_9FLAO|nr:hypothetical protein [Kordia algicida]EDP96590.1 hypothetical protein KAOT1_15543 [Kordia algicida OT-1]
MKSLKLKKVKISRIGNPHILFGGASNDNGCTTAPPPPPLTLNIECIKSMHNECDTVTNTTGGQRTSGRFSGGTDDGE